jgi:hypothetical protein
MPTCGGAGMVSMRPADDDDVARHPFSPTYPSYLCAGGADSRDAGQPSDQLRQRKLLHMGQPMIHWN